jgi:hypothetical protein
MPLLPLLVEADGDECVFFMFSLLSCRVRAALLPEGPLEELAAAAASACCCLLLEGRISVRALLVDVGGFCYQCLWLLAEFRRHTLLFTYAAQQVIAAPEEHSWASCLAAVNV